MLTENKGKGVEITEGDKQLVACLLWEFIYPTMSYSYILDTTILPFLLQLNSFQDMNYFDFAVTTLFNYCTDDELRSWTAHIFRIMCESCVTYSYIDEERRKDQTKYLPLLVRLASYPRVMGAWARSETFYVDIENAFFTHLPSRTDLEHMFPYIYYPGTIFQTSSKALFYRNMATQCLRCATNQEILLELTKLLLSDTPIPMAGGTPVVPRVATANFLDWLVKKNVKYIQEFVSVSRSQHRIGREQVGTDAAELDQQHRVLHPRVP
ncbi:MAG: hypothetical protein P4M11_08875 [Candidatus Pacebacteria bacterium]|nr:hypothetical protein [Candidatus Paceibacterota bacterium]